MINLSFIAQLAYETLEKSAQEITPKSFTREFCKAIKEYELTHEECEYFENLLEILELEDDENFSKETIHDIYELSDKLYKKHSQDRSIILRNTTDISKLLVIINEHLIESITGNKDKVNEIIKIRNEIETFELDSHMSENLIYLKDKLVDAAGDIETHVNKVTDKLETSATEVDRLKNKIRNLEEELNIIKKAKETDHLTGVLTRRSYEKEIRKFENHFKSQNQQYAIIFIDLDHFKLINDTYGHEGGDLVLKTIASILMKLTRDDDIIGRYGGEEFVVGFRYFNEDEIVKYITRIKGVLSSKQIVYKEYKISVTFSAGVALRIDQSSYQETLSLADKRLYEAKNSGRNKVIIPFGEPL
jgi:diguanylate cyclase (GGDEF)-like protein